MNIEHRTQNDFGTDHTYIVKPDGLRELWERITGKKTINNGDLKQLHELAVLFGAGASSRPIA